MPDPTYKTVQKKSPQRLLVKKSENMITYPTPAVSHALSIFNIFMAFVFHHGCDSLIHVIPVAHLRDRGVLPPILARGTEPRGGIDLSVINTASTSSPQKLAGTNLTQEILA